MSRAFFVLRTLDDRNRVRLLAAQAPDGTRVEFKMATRTIPQNNRMWVMLTEISQQVRWDDGKRLTPTDWKLLFLDALSREMRLVPSIDGRRFVNLGRLSSELTKDEMTQLIELIFAFGAEHDVIFRDQEGHNDL